LFSFDKIPRPNFFDGIRSGWTTTAWGILLPSRQVGSRGWWYLLSRGPGRKNSIAFLLLAIFGHILLLADALRGSLLLPLALSTGVLIPR